MPRRAFFLALLAAAVSCGGEMRAPSHASSSKPTVDPASAAAPPGWAFRYRRANNVLVRLEGNKRIEVGEHGERWLVTPHGRERASTYFPTAIVAGVVASDGEIAFATKDGTIFPVAAADPLGPIGAPRRPPRELGQLVIGRRAILARAGRDVMRSVDAGRTWSVVDIGGAPRSLRSIALTRDGIGALVQIPQRTMITVDDGGSWSHVTPPPHGVSEVKVDDEGARVLAASTHGETSTELASSPPRWIPVRPAASASTHADDTREPALAYLEAWAPGAAVMAGTTWLEVVGTEKDAELWSEDLTGVARSRRIRTFPECGDAYRVAASADARTIAVACRGSSKSTEPIVFRSTDAGETWSLLPPLVTPTDYALGVHVAGDRIVVTGACVPDRSVPCPLETVSGTGGAWSNLQLDAKPPLPLRLGGLAASGSGFVGIATDEVDEPSVVVSSDGVRAEITKRFGGARGFDHVSRDGDLVVVETTDHEAPLQVSRDAGRTWTATTFPTEVHDWEALSFAGARGLATTANDVFETLDAGTTWSRLDTPLITGPRTVRCGPKACVLSDTLRRIGWNARPTGAAAPKPAEPGPRRVVLDDDTMDATFTCVPAGRTESVNGVIDAALVDLPNGVRWSLLVRGPDGVRVVSERRGARETSALIKHGPPLFFQAENGPDGAAFVEFPGECAPNCHGYLYATTGPISVSWLPVSGGAVRRASLWPDEKMMREPVDARVMPDGNVLVAVAGDAYVLDATGKRVQKIRGHAWEMITVAKKPISVTGAVTFLDNGEGARTATTWTLDPYASRGNITRLRGQPFAWTQVKTDAFLVKLDKVEEEPSSVTAVDVAKLLSTKPFPACTAGSRGELRVPFTFDPPAALTILLAHEKRPPTFTASEIVVRSTPEGKACVSGIVALSGDRQHGIILDLADPSHATTWRNGRTLPSFLESVSCRAR